MQKFKKNCILLENLTEKEMSLFEKKIKLKNFRNKETIIRENNTNEYLYIIEDGVVKVDTFKNNKKQTLSFLKEGDFFGEIAIFTKASASANVVSVTSSNIYMINKNDLDILMIRIPKLALNMINYLAIRVKNADLVIYDYAFKMLEARVASKLLGLVHMFKGKDKDKTFINLPITHQDLADYVGTSRETVTKILSKLKEIKAIDIETKKIIILDEKKLELWMGE